MGLFKGSKMTFDSHNTETVVGYDAYFQGTFTIKGSLKVDGRLDGSIVDGKMVTVGKTGKIKGDVSCEQAIVLGEIKGNINALENIEIMAGSRVEGDLKAPKITLEEGSFFNGHCTMLTKADVTSHKQEKVKN
ncbi:MAG: polymer-forming cytoskeletal protein [Elusimicrobiales bacterium]|nr:polymer-forming cytoskeletal protein [Elusimicrobiales bacterium]